MFNVAQLYMSCIVVVIRPSKGNQTKITDLPQIIQKKVEIQLILSITDHN